MNTYPSDIHKKIRINGIKLSNELVLVSLLDRFPLQNSRALFFRLLSQNQINAPFVLITGMGEAKQGLCCVAAENAGQVERLVAVNPELEKKVEFVSSVGAVSVFPHRSNLKLLGLSFYLFGEASLPMYGMASSISAFTFITDYPQLDSAVAKLLEYVTLPPNHAPFRPEIQVIQQKK